MREFRIYDKLNKKLLDKEKFLIDCNGKIFYIEKGFFKTTKVLLKNQQNYLILINEIFEPINIKDKNNNPLFVGDKIEIIDGKIYKKEIEYE